MATTTLLERRNATLGTGAPLFYQEPVHIVRGSGVELFDANGRRYLDMYNNVPCVGHCHPHVVEALTRQAQTLNVHSRYLHEGIVDYAERLAARHCEGIDSVVFSCTGTEANEVAIAMARSFTGGQGIITSSAAYHGNSHMVGKLTHLGESKRHDDVRAFPFPDLYRPAEQGLSEAALCNLYLERIADAIEDFKARGVPLAGLLVCSIFANEGLPNIPEGFMAKAAKLIREAGGLVIADEVQAGVCRPGRWWGYEVTGFEPDIAVMGKPLGNGLPLAATAASSEIVNAFRKRSRYFNTFASSPMQAAVGSAVLDVIENENLLTTSAAVGQHMRDALRQLSEQVEAMGDVRGHGLFIGIDWVSDRGAHTPDREGAAQVVNTLKDKGFLISNAGALGNVLKIRPPLAFRMEHAEEFLSAFAETVC